MKIQVLLFGIVTDLLETSQLEIDIDEHSTILEFKLFLKQNYPKLKNLSSYAFAVNENYATDDLILNKGDVVAIIPPVSGG